MIASKIFRRACLPMLLITLLAGCGSNTSVPETANAATQGTPVSTTRLIRQDFTEYGEYYGTLVPATEAVLTVPGGGTVEAINAREGDLVHAGETLAAIDAESALAAYRVAELNERIAEETYRRQQELLARGNASRVAVDQAELAWLSAGRDLLSARKILEGARCESPMDGMILSRHIELFNELPQGAATFTVADTSLMRVKIGIPESDIAGVAVGNSATVSFDTYPGKSWQGTLARLDGQVSADTLSFEAEITIENSEGRLPPGLTARVVLERGILNNTIVVPTEAVLTEGELSFVMLVENEQAHRVNVTTGPVNERETVILSGVRGDEELIIEGNHLVNDGTPVSTVTREG